MASLVFLSEDGTVEIQYVSPENLAYFKTKYDEFVASNYATIEAVPTKTSDLTNDKQFQTLAEVNALIASSVASMFEWKGVVENVGALPPEGNEVGDVYHVSEDSSEYVWNGTAWESLGTPFTLAWDSISGKPSTFPPSEHTHTKSQITDFPESLPASDVYAWAKAETKPTYTASEVGAASSSHSHAAFKGASSSAAGTTGFVPAPSIGSQSSFLRGDGTWATVPTPEAMVAMTTEEIDSLFT